MGSHAPRPWYCPPLVRTSTAPCDGTMIKPGWEVPSRLSPGPPLLFLTHTHQCTVPFLGAANHNLDVWPQAGRAGQQPLTSCAAFQAHSNGKPFRTETKEGPNPQCKPYFSSLFLLHYCLFVFGLLTKGDHILSLHQSSPNCCQDTHTQHPHVTSPHSNQLLS